MAFRSAPAIVMAQIDACFPRSRVGTGAMEVRGIRPDEAPVSGPETAIADGAGSRTASSGELPAGTSET